MPSGHEKDQQNDPKDKYKLSKTEADDLIRWSEEVSRRFVSEQRAVSPSDIEDVIQEAILGIYRLVHDDPAHRRLVQDEGHAKRYLYRRMQYSLNSLLQERQRQRDKSLSLADIDVAQHTDDNSQAALNDLGDAIDSLQPIDREIIHRVAKGMSSREIAAELGLRYSTVRRRQLKAMSELRKTLRDPRYNKSVDQTTTENLEPESVPVGHTLEFPIHIEPGEATQEDIREVLRAINDLHIASGGFGLEFRVDDLLVTDRKAVPT